MGLDQFLCAAGTLFYGESPAIKGHSKFAAILQTYFFDIEKRETRMRKNGKYAFPVFISSENERATRIFAWLFFVE